MTTNINILQKKLNRALRAQEIAEETLEEKSRELFLANEKVHKNTKKLIRKMVNLKKH
ncbi:hypothetical protein [Piscirickettsia litoralis]|uniref:hypothetical protein n=1 Tax=Piscirickettsia litoralis TaxID=1891921 RepID=UPI0013012CFE|nr:hypothetical protein [Piscirickettsia litoralis]